MTASPLLLLGAQRSGTTALAHVLSAAYADHGGIFTVNGRLPYLLPRWCRPEDLHGRHFRADELVHAIRRKPAEGRGSERWLAHVEAVLRRVAAETAAGLHHDCTLLVRQILQDCYRPWPLWGDKYNEYLLDLGSLLTLLDRPKILLLVRHPTEVARSQLEWQGDRPWRPVTLAAAELKWASWHDGWLTEVDRLAPASWMMVQYSRLCRGELDQAVTDFVGAELSGRLRVLAPRREGESGEPLTEEAARVWNSLLKMESAS
jgi:hypothetical protein